MWGGGWLRKGVGKHKDSITFDARKRSKEERARKRCSESEKRKKERQSFGAEYARTFQKFLRINPRHACILHPKMGPLSR